MNKNRLVIGISIVGIIILLTTSVIIKMYYISIEKKYEYVVNNIIEASKKCVLEEKCNANIITLNELYKYNYIEKQINPKTKDEFDKKSYIKTLNYEFVAIS